MNMSGEEKRWGGHAPCQLHGAQIYGHHGDRLQNGG
jgi:hypothetical protein